MVHVAGRLAGRGVPLWQAAQPLVMPVWLKFAGVQASVVWQLSHSAVVGDVIGGLAGGAHAVVAGAAGAGRHAGVVEARRRPARRDVAGFAGVALGMWLVPLPVAVVPLWQ